MVENKRKIISFSEVINSIYIKLGEKLPGELAHSIMTPYKRTTKKDVDGDVNVSAVLLLLYPKNNNVHFALIERSDYKGVHGGQISFPGGRNEEGESLKETAIRETEEEIGVKKEDIQILGELTEVYISASNFLVTPFVGFLDYTPQFTPEKREVKQVLEVALDDLMNEENVKVKKIEIKTYDKNKLYIEAPYFSLNNKVVWGATAVILSEIKVMLKDLYE